MASVDLSLNPYERLVNTSRSTPYHLDFFCVCKDELLDNLSKIVKVENFDKYKCYSYGSINSSNSYPTWDCDLMINSSTGENLEEILEIFKQIKNIGMEQNLNYDLKYETDIEKYNRAIETPDVPFHQNSKGLGYDISNNEFVLYDTSRNLAVRKSSHKAWTYYKPLLIKAENSDVLEQNAIDFITNSNLPDSSERNNEFAIRRRYVFNQETQKYTKTYL